MVYNYMVYDHCIDQCMGGKHWSHKDINHTHMVLGDALNS